MVYKDLTSQKFGRLTVIEDTGKRQGRNVLWSCRCDCGNTTEVSTGNLRSGNNSACGCIRAEQARVNIASFVERNLAIIAREGTSPARLNARISKNNKTGVKGVYERKGKFEASITFKRKYIYLGTFSTLEEAATARKEAEGKYFKPILEKYGHQTGGNNMDCNDLLKRILEEQEKQTKTLQTIASSLEEKNIQVKGYLVENMERLSEELESLSKDPFNLSK